VRITRLVDHVFRATAVLADGREVDARPSDALDLALVSRAPIAADADVLEHAERYAATRPEFAAEVVGPHDGSSVLADEVRERLAEKAREIAALSQPGATAP
jgi:bifunctional DNase/RNase